MAGVIPAPTPRLQIMFFLNRISPPGKNLMHLRSERLKSGQGAPVAIVFEAGCESLRPFEARAPGESEAPAMIGIRSVQRPAKGGIEIDLNASETLLQNGQDRNAP